MSEEVKRYERSTLAWKLKAELESERQARLLAETKLRELQDAIDRVKNLDPKYDELEPHYIETLLKNIQESRTRKQT